MHSSKVKIVANTSSGILNFRLPFIEHCIESGYEVDVFSFDDSERDLNIIKKKLNFFNVDTRACKSLRRILNARRAIRKLQDHYDHAVYYGIFSVIFAFGGNERNRKLFLTGLGSGFLGSVFDRIIFSGLLLLANLKFNEIFVLNEQDKRYVRKFFWRKIVVHFGEGQEIFLISQENKVAATKPLKMAFVGRLIEDKGIREFLDLTNLCPDYEFHIFGDFDANNPSGIERAEFERILCENKRVHWHGHVEKSLIWSQADCLIMTSRREGLSTVVAEAVANRVVVAGFSCPGVDDVFDAIGVQNHLLVKERSVAALAHALHNGIDHFPTDRMSKNLLEIWDLRRTNQFDELIGN